MDNFLYLKIINILNNNKNNFLSFSDYMHLCLYYPKFGYYSKNLFKLDQDGDFFTSPELGSNFGDSLSVRINSLLLSIDGPSILEIGAGSGLLANSILSNLFFFKSNFLFYLILEPSYGLRKEQMKNINTLFLKKVFWVTKVPIGFKGIIIANEVLDALPVDCFILNNNFFYERVVFFNKKTNSLNWKLEKPNKILINNLLNYNVFLKNVFYSSEINVSLFSFLFSLYNSLSRGYVLFFDYGFSCSAYYSYLRRYGTLSCFYKHTMNDNPFFSPGFQDITFFVDFGLAYNISKLVGYDFLSYGSLSSFINFNFYSTNSFKSGNSLLVGTQGDMGSVFKYFFIGNNLDNYK